MLAGFDTWVYHLLAVWLSARCLVFQYSVFLSVTWDDSSSHIILMRMLLLSRFSRVRLCATPWTAAHQAPPSLGLSRQEHWSGLPFPSPMHESEKWKWSRSVVSDSATPWTAAYQAPASMGFSRQEYWSGVPLPSPLMRMVTCKSLRMCIFLLLNCNVLKNRNLFFVLFNIPRIVHMYNISEFYFWRNLLNDGIYPVFTG